MGYRLSWHHHISPIDCSICCEHTKEICRAMKTYSRKIKTNKAPNWIIRKSGSTKVECSNRRERNKITFRTAKCHETSKIKLFWLNHVENGEPLLMLFFPLLNKSGSRSLDLHAFKRFPLVYIQTLFVISLLQSSPPSQPSKKTENCFENVFNAFHQFHYIAIFLIDEPQANSARIELILQL